MIVALLRSTADRYTRHTCSELAAAIAYRVLFALVPFVALLAAILDAVLSPAARADVVDWLLRGFPGSTVETGVDQALTGTAAITSLAGVFAFGALMWTASGMTRSLRLALAVVWETPTQPAFVRAKLRDVLALGVLAALLLAVFALSLLTQVALQAGAGFARATEVVITVAATFAALVLIYRLAAPVRTPFADVWRGALATALAIDVGVAGYAFYLVQIASFDTVYGPLGAVLAFLALLYVVAALLLFGAELVAGEPRRAAARKITRTG